MVKYCTCKKKHRHKHKKECEEFLKLAAEHAAKLHDEKLFKQPPAAEDCQLCFIRLPTLCTGRKYYECCGKEICSGCIHAPVYDNQGNVVDNQKCAFCRVPTSIGKNEELERYKLRVEKDDPMAIYEIGICYRDGTHGYPQNNTKALELWHRAADLGHAGSYSCIGYAYSNGQGVEVDRKKAVYYYELGAIGGDSEARHNLGSMEGRAGNIGRALRHYLIAVHGGHNPPLKIIKDLYSNGQATKDDYTTALRSYQEYLGEIKSKQRDEAAAFSDRYRYYESGV